MGGNALKHLGIQRLPRTNYELLAADVLQKLRDFRCASVPSYREKAAFGDLDVIVGIESPSNNLRERVQKQFQPREIFTNGECLSFDYQNFQVDLILTPPGLFDIALFYYSFNDLNNLVGRIAHRMGLKFGHKGLSLPVTLNTTHWGDIVLSTQPEEIYRFLQYDHNTYSQGFETLENIFLFVTSSPYFSKNLFLAEQMNHKHRLRHRKRDTYRQFLSWLETTKLPLKEHDWDEDGTNYTVKSLEFFDKHLQWHDIMIDINKHQEVHAKLNGHLISQWTGLKGKALGDFIQQLKQQWADRAAMEHWILGQTDGEIKKFVQEKFKL